MNEVGSQVPDAAAIVIDVETTGLDYAKDRVIEVAAVRLGDLRTIFESYVQPSQAVPAEVQELTGITDDTLRNQPPFHAVAEELRDAIQSSSAVLGYNVGFDKCMLDAEFGRLGLVVQWPPLVCVKRVWDHVEPPTKRTLGACYQRFMGKPMEDAHRAKQDAVATATCMHKIMQEHRGRIVPIEGPVTAYDPDSATLWGGTTHFQWRDGKLTCGFGKHAGAAAASVGEGYYHWILTQSFPAHVMRLAAFMVAKPRTQVVVDTWARDWT